MRSEFFFEVLGLFEIELELLDLLPKVLFDNILLLLEFIIRVAGDLPLS